MAVVRIDDKLLREIKGFVEREENRYKYPSVSAFLNLVIYEKMHEISEKKKKK